MFLKFFLKLLFPFLFDPICLFDKVTVNKGIGYYDEENLISMHKDSSDEHIAQHHEFSLLTPTLFIATEGDQLNDGEDHNKNAHQEAAKSECCGYSLRSFKSCTDSNELEHSFTYSGGKVKEGQPADVCLITDVLATLTPSEEYEKMKKTNAF